MALPVTISGASFSAQNSYLGPFKSSSGNYYVFLRDNTFPTQIEAWKATDPSSSFSNVGTNPTLTNSVQSMWCYQEGDEIHVGHQSVTTGRVGRSTFNMSTDSWTTSNQTVESPADAPTSNAVGCSIAHRSDGDLVILYNGDTDKDMGTSYDRVDYAWWNGSSWSAGNTVVTDMTSFDVGTDWTGAVIVRGSADRMHLCFKDHTNADAYIRTLSGAATPALESMTFGSGAVDSSIATGAFHPWIKGHSYFDGSNHRVHCYYVDTSSTLSQIAFTSADAPTYGSPTTGVTDNMVEGTTTTAPHACVAGDDDDTHFLYVEDATDDLLHDVNADEGGFGTDTRVIDVSANANYTDINRIFCNVYDRDGVGTVIAVLLQDGSAIKYTELSDGTNTNAIDINKSYSALSSMDGGTILQNTYNPPVLIGGALYGVFPSENGTKLTMLKTTSDPPADGNWANADDPIHVWTCASDELGSGVQGQRVGGPGSQDFIKSIWTFIHSSDIYVVTQQESGRVAYHIFDPGTDAWTTRDTTVVLAGATNFDIRPDIPAVTCAVRSDGDIVIIAAYDDGFQTLRCFTVEGSTITNRGEATTGNSSTDYYGPVAVGPDGSDRITWLYVDATDNDMLYRSITSANSLGSHVSIDSTTDTALLIIGAPIFDGSVAYIPYIDADDQISVYSFTPGDTPSGSSTATGVSDNTVEGNGRSTPPFVVACAAVRSNGDIHFMYANDADQDIYRDVDTGGGFGTDSEEVDAVTCNMLSAYVNEPSDVDLDYFYLNGSTWTFGKFQIAAGTAPTYPIGTLHLLGVGA